MAIIETKEVNINYTSRDFNSIRNELVEYAKKYYPNTYQDFSEASFGSLMVDTVAYVGDVLSFYLDYQANESFLDSSIEYNNVIRHGRQLGYKFRANPSSYGKATFFASVPAKSNGIGINTNAVPILKKGSELGSSSGGHFVLAEDVDFSKSSNEVVVAKVDDDTGKPTHYAIKAKGEIVSGRLNTDTFTIDSFSPFKKIKMSDTNVSEILSVVDSDGNEYFEVEYLSQDTVYMPIINHGSSRSRAPAIIKPVAVPRRFVTIQEEGSMYLQFGGGNESHLTREIIRDPRDVVLDLHGVQHVKETSFDPYNMVNTDQLGVGPSNTTISVTYRTNTVSDVNTSARTVTVVKSPILKFPISADGIELDFATMNEIQTSIEVLNEEPIIGDVSLPSTVELKHRINGAIASQNRAVTKQDYINLVYRMPPQFGAIKKCSIMQDSDSAKRNLNLYVVSEASDGSYTKTNATVKNNIKNWLLNYKMINDTVDIMDAGIVNFGVYFELVSQNPENKFLVLERDINALSERFTTPFEIGQAISVSSIYSMLNRVRGVADVLKIDISNKIGPGYSSAGLDIKSYTSPDGRYVTLPNYAVFEMKFPSKDIKGTIK